MKYTLNVEVVVKSRADFFSLVSLIQYIPLTDEKVYLKISFFIGIAIFLSTDGVLSRPGCYVPLLKVVKLPLLRSELVGYCSSSSSKSFVFFVLIPNITKAVAFFSFFVNKLAGGGAFLALSGDA